MRKLTLLAMVFFISWLPVSGCNCKSGGGKAPKVTITSPADGKEITGADDINSARVGIQIPVVARVENVAEGSAATVLVNDDTNLALSNFVSGGLVSFSAVTVVGRSTDGSALITVTVRDRDSDATAKADVTVVVKSAGTVDCEFINPLADAILGETDDADPATRGFQYDVVLQCSEDMTGTPANLSVDGRSVPSAVFAGSSVTFSSVTLNEGQNTLAGQLSAAAGSWDGQIRVTVDTPNCELRLQPEGAVAFNLDGDAPRRTGFVAVADADGDANNGIQAALTATSPDCQGSQAVLQVEGNDVATVDVTSTSVDFGTVDLPDGNPVRVQVEVRPPVAGGASGLSVPQDFLVDSLRPTPLFIFPAANDLLGAPADKDGDPSNGVQIDAVVEIPGLEGAAAGAGPDQGAAISVLLTNIDTGATSTASCIVGVDGCADPSAADRYLLEVTLDADGSYTLDATVTDPAGNVGSDGPVGFALSTVVGSAAISTPLEGAMVNRSAVGATDTSILIEVSASALPAGSPVTVVCSGAEGTGTGALDATGVASVDVSFNALPCAGAVASCSANVEVGGATISAPAVTFTLDLTPPGITIAVPADGSTLYSSSVSVEVVTVCLEDGQQVQVDSLDGQTANRAISANGAILPFSFGSGGHQISASASDAAGNAATSAQISFSVDANPPLVVFVQPGSGSLFSAADDVDAGLAGVQVPVTVQVPNKPSGTAVVLQIGVDDGGTTVWLAPSVPLLTDASFRAVFPAVTLPEGPARVRATASAGSGLSGQAEIGLTVNTGGVSCNVVAPSDGSALGAPDDLNGNTSDGVQADVRVRSSAADGSAVDLALTDPAGNATTLNGTVSGGVATFNSVGFLAAAGTQHGVSSLMATCDVGGQATPSLPATITVDLEAPVAVIADPLDGAVFNLASTDVSAAPGFQIDFSGTATDPSSGSSVAAGATGTLVVTCDSGRSDTLPIVFSLFGSQPQAQTRVTLDDQSSCSLSFTVTDLAGNVSAPVSASLRVDRIAPTVTLPGLITGQLFNAGDDSSGVSGFQRDVRVAFTGVDAAGSVALLVSNTYGDLGTTGWALRPAEGSPITPNVAAVDQLFSGATLTLGSADTVTLTAESSDSAGNVAQATVTVSVDLVAPSVNITRPDPAALPTCFNVFSDVDQAASGLQIQVNVGTVGVADGLPLSLCAGVDPGTGLGSCVGDPSLFIVDQSTVSGDVAVFVPATFQDGTQVVQAEVQDRAGNFSSSTPFTMCVDTTPPDVLSMTVDTDTALPAGTINAQELAAGGGQVCVSAQVAGAEGQSASLVTNNPVAGTVVATGIVNAGALGLCGTLAEGGHALKLIVTDAAGNPNLSSTPLLLDPEAELPLIVDTTAPNISITSPIGTVLNAASDANSATPDFDFDFGVGSDAGDGQAISYLVDGAPVGSASLAGGVASLAAQSLAQGPHSLRVEVIDVAGNSAFAERAVSVDTIAPSARILSPASGAIVNTSSVGVQLSIGGAAAGDALLILDQTTGSTLATRTVAASQPQTENVTLADASYQLVAQVTDGAGNVGSSAPVQLTVDTLGCSIRWTTPANASVVFNAANDEQLGTAGLQTTVIANTSDCAGRNVELWVAGSPVSTQASNSSSGDASFLLDLADGSSGVAIEAKITDAASNTTSTLFTAAVDITPPGLSRTAPTGTAFTFVAATNKHLAAGTFNGTTVIQDKVAGGSAEVDLSYSVTGAMGGLFSLKVAGVDLVTPVNITTDPQTVALTSAVIAQNTIGSLDAQVVDAAGNGASDAPSITVDVQAPDVPVVTPSLSDARAATVGLAWADTGDDASTGSATAYDLRWSRADIANETDFAAATPASLVVTPGAPGTAKNAAVTPLPPINTYWLALRVEDEVGNRSPLTNVVSQANLWTQTTLTGEGGFFGWQIEPLGDINNDGFADFATTAITLTVTGASQAGAVYVYFGGAAYSGQDARRQKLVTGVAGDLLGIDISAGDVSGDGIPDLVVGAFGYSGARGRVRIYFGQDRSTTNCSTDFTLCWLNPADFVELRGDLAGGGQFGKSVFANADLGQSGGGVADGMKEVIIGAPNAASSAGRSYVYWGRSKAQWLLDQSATDDSGVTHYVPVSAAGLSLDGAAVNDGFGYRWGQVSLGDLNADGHDELGLTASTAATEYIYDGVALAALSGNNSAASAATNVLSGTLAAPSATASQKANALGARAIAVNVRGAATPDLILSSADSRRVFIYPTSSAGVGTVLQTLRVTTGVNVANFGFDLAAGDLNMDGRPDLAVGSNNSASPSGAYLFYNTGSGTYYSSQPDSDLTNASGGWFGISVDVGDYNGSGRVDLLVSNPLNGTITVYHQ